MAIGSVAAELAGCGGSRGASPLPMQQPNGGITERPLNKTYKTLYSFKGGSEDGFAPYAGLTDLNGFLYGTMGSPIDGTVFQISMEGKERVLYAFKGGSDGEDPGTAGVTKVNGTLYGTTQEGGRGSCGTVSRPFECGTIFRVSTAGKEQVLYIFKGGTDGWYPSGGLTYSRGMLYGTTEHGGKSCAASSYFTCGTVFVVSTSGKERVLYRFKGSEDGGSPYAGVTVVSDTIYGTTFFNGGGACSVGCGTIFEVSAAGKERTLYTFKGGRDGAHPQSDLIAVNGTLYGTTSSGGTSSCSTAGGFAGCGTVFSVSTSGKEHVLYRFKGGSDGQYPQGLLAINGVLYGTTYLGGTGKCASGCGTIFKMDASGAKTVLYDFKAPPDGVEPHAPLAFVRGKLYGTTVSGGPYCPYLIPPGCGTVFSISP